MKVKHFWSGKSLEMAFKLIFIFGYIDVGDGCWGQKLMIRDLACIFRGLTWQKCHNHNVVVTYHHHCKLQSVLNGKPKRNLKANLSYISLCYWQSRTHQWCHRFTFPRIKFWDINQVMWKVQIYPILRHKNYWKTDKNHFFLWISKSFWLLLTFTLFNSYYSFYNHCVCRNNKLELKRIQSIFKFILRRFAYGDHPSD